MKKSLLLCLLALSVTCTTNTGCIKSPDGGGTNISLPDLSSFSVAASTFVQGASAIISIASSSLGSGTFTVNYSLSGANNLVNQVATLIMNGGNGTFSTPALNNVNAGTTITINSISNSAGGSANPTGNNVQTFSDSSGLMTATMTGTGGGPTTFRGTHVTASLAGSLLSIDGVVWTPWLTTITLYIDNYTNTIGTTQFNSNDLSPTSITSTFNGSASYGVAGNGLAISDLSQHGKITITSTAPLITGTFSYTNSDSSVINSGSFSCPAP